MTKTSRPKLCSSGIGCSLWKTCKNVCIQGEGKATHPYVMFIGEAPGAAEDHRRKVFVGPSGKLIRSLIEEMQLTDDCYFTNAVRCRPPDNRNPTAKEMRICNKYLIAEIERVKPQHLVLLGTFAIRAITGEDRVSVSEKRGVRSWEFMGIPVIATYHPAAVLRSRKKYFGPICDDLNRLVSKEYTKPEKVKWTFHKKVTPKLLWKEMAFDLETSQLSPYLSGARILCVSWSGRDHISRVTTDITGFVTALTVMQPRLVGHNVKFDLSWLQELHGYVHAGEIEDTMILSHLSDENRRSKALKYLASKYTGYGNYAVDVMAKRSAGKLDELSEERLYKYCAYDSAATWILYKYLYAECEDQNLIKLYDSQLVILRTIIDMQSRGFQVGKAKIASMSIDLEAQMIILEKSIQKRTGEINISSNKQLADVLFNQLGYPALQKTKSGASSVGIDALTAIEDQVPAGLSSRKARGLITEILEHRQLRKLRGTYLDGVLKNMDSAERVHPSYNITGTMTGRLSCSDPNQQNIPRESTAPIKKIYVAPFGRALVMADYSQIELRVCAWITRDSTMLDCFKMGLDLHTETARAILGQDPTSEERTHAKIVNFGVLYGMGSKALARQTNQSEVWAQRYLRDWQATYPGVLSWKQKIKSELLEMGYVTSAFGRRRRLPMHVAGGPFQYEAMLRQACNFPIQGTAGEICNMAMVVVDNALKERFKNAWVYGAVHDQIMVECRWGDRKRVARIMQRVMSDTNAVVEYFGFKQNIDVPTPVDVEIGQCWANMEEFTK